MPKDRVLTGCVEMFNRGFVFPINITDQEYTSNHLISLNESRRKRRNTIYSVTGSFSVLLRSFNKDKLKEEWWKSWYCIQSRSGEKTDQKTSQKPSPTLPVALLLGRF